VYQNHPSLVILRTAADTKNDRVLPFFEQQNIPALRVLTDRGTECCGSTDKHPYHLYLQLNEMEPTKTKVPGFVSGFTRRYWMSFIGLRFGKRFIATLKPCKPI
jgi:hypothetical protein